MTTSFEVANRFAYVSPQSTDSEEMSCNFDDAVNAGVNQIDYLKWKLSQMYLASLVR